MVIVPIKMNKIAIANLNCIAWEIYTVLELRTDKVYESNLIVWKIINRKVVIQKLYIQCGIKKWIFMDSIYFVIKNVFVS